MYFLPQIHKGITPPRGRPIVSANGSPTEKMSIFIDHFPNTPSTLNKSYVKDTTHFLKLIRDAGVVPQNSYLMTLDVIPLYTNIPTPSGIQAAKQALVKFRPNTDLKPQNDSLIKLLECILTKNNFQFDNKLTGLYIYHYFGGGLTIPCNTGNSNSQFGSPTPRFPRGRCQAKTGLQMEAKTCSFSILIRCFMARLPALALLSLALHCLRTIMQFCTIESKTHNLSLAYFKCSLEAYQDQHFCLSSDPSQTSFTSKDDMVKLSVLQHLNC